MTKYNGINIDYTRDSLFSQHGLALLKIRLREGEKSPQEAFARVAVDFCGGDLELAQRIYDYASKKWIGFSTPVLANAVYPNEKRKSLPISCFLGYVDDSIPSLLAHTTEIANLTILGGGTGGHWGDVRSKDKKSPGVIPFVKSMDTIIETYHQGAANRRGAYAAYLDVSHPDIMEFIKLRVPTGDSSRKCHSIGFHNAVNISDDFMNAVINNENWSLIDPNTKKVKEIIKARELWEEILTVRARTGEPYILFSDTVNRALPESQKKLGLKNRGSNLCIEIMLATNQERTAVCCLSSLNYEYFQEWRDTSIVEDMITFLDNVLQVFIDNAPESISKAKFSAERERALGLGAMGWHSFLKRYKYTWDSKDAFLYNGMIQKLVHKRAKLQSLKLGKERGEAPDMVGTGYRNSHLLAIAPTANNSTVVGCSPGIDPDSSNAYVHNSGIGSYFIKDKYLQMELELIGKNDEETWKKISENDGSVQNLDIPDHIKNVFKTAREINQVDIISQAAIRQKYLCQSQSLNLFFDAKPDKGYFNKVHLLAWKLGVKSLYYCRSKKEKKSGKTEIDRINLNTPKSEECEACQ